MLPGTPGLTGEDMAPDRLRDLLVRQGEWPTNCKYCSESIGPTFRPFCTHSPPVDAETVSPCRCVGARNKRGFPGEGGCPSLSTSSQVALVEKNSPANAGDLRDMGSIPGSGRPPGGEHGSPLQYSCLENPMDRGAWRAIVHGVARSQTRLK